MQTPPTALLSSPNEIVRLLDGAIRTQINAVIDAEVDSAKVRLEKAVRGTVGSIAATVLQNFSFERMGQDLVIRVKFAFPESKKPEPEVYPPERLSP